MEMSCDTDTGCVEGGGHLSPLFPLVLLYLFLFLEFTVTFKIISSFFFYY